MNRRTFTTLGLAAAWQAVATRLKGDELDSSEPSTGRPNAALPTLGGRQFWADELFFHGWHIQRNVLSGHYRLLDEANVRHAWGRHDECCAKLARIKSERGLAPMRGPAVVVLHGLFRSAASMSRMAHYLAERGGYTVFNVNYPTTRGELAEHAAGLAKILASLEGIEEINFVAHSLGNLVVRHYLGDHTNADSGLVPDARIKRMVMLGSPNRGAKMAEAFDSKMFHLVAGASGRQLSRQWSEVETRLLTPGFEFGILAGGRGTAKGYNPLLGEDNDMVVSVETTRLAGAADFAVLPALHTLLMDDATVQRYTLNFLRHGYFISAAERQPIPSPEAPQA